MTVLLFSARKTHTSCPGGEKKAGHLSTAESGGTQQFVYLKMIGELECTGFNRHIKLSKAKKIFCMRYRDV